MNASYAFRQSRDPGGFGQQTQSRHQAHAPERRLLAEVLCQAFRDAESVNQEIKDDAILFLCGKRGRYFLELLGYEEKQAVIQARFEHELIEIQERRMKERSMRMKAYRKAKCIEVSRTPIETPQVPNESVQSYQALTVQLALNF